jgi:LPS export ABC transporter protein LptC
MLKTLLIPLSILVLALSYLPLRQQTNYVTAEQNRLLIDMQQTASLFLNRQEPNKRFRLISEHLTFDEAKDQTSFTPFSVIGHTGQQAFKGESKTATLTQLEMNLMDEVSLQQSSPNKHTRTFQSAQLFIHLKTHQLSSPGKIQMTDDQQRIEADSLIGNYEEGWYEFTQHVKTLWQ